MNDMNGTFFFFFNNHKFYSYIEFTQSNIFWSNNYFEKKKKNY